MKKIFNSLPLIVTHLFLFFLTSCTIQKTSSPPHLISPSVLKNGDLIFVGALDEGLSGAIKRATILEGSYNYDHVGIVERTTNGIYVLHAAPKGGSQREELNQFYTLRKTEQNSIIVYRLKKNYTFAIPHAITQASTMLGKPYNWTYILNENEYYCSDFVERAFRKDQIFEHIPMNFKNKSSGEIDTYWIEFYTNLNQSVPQGYPGTNPNQLSQSSKLEMVGSLELYLTK
ncbi:YiiX/YebB-like N1pC/P60 family cysteine hydrolase [Faecalibacter sp. LW9]|uniref:YiiX/YebB-like N1pC/P60 family cysteine hydrolase n=1 Tax=Faecalibacter sp. LW9 TaxID=3103144 RepID=UPI002AFFDA42|nr:YiiX/YebB-like N1pC/P60 family cysteine hydrolase [Faecalibacter sp. LW9]